MMMTRRTVARAAAWTTPAALIAAPAPSYAASTSPLTCVPEICKREVDSRRRTWEYRVRPGCSGLLAGETVTRVQIRATTGGPWVDMAYDPGQARWELVKVHDGADQRLRFTTSGSRVREGVFHFGVC